MAPRHGASPGAIPGNRTKRPRRLRVSTRQSLQNSAYSGRHGGSLPSSWGRGRQAMHLLCKQVDVGALPTDSTISLRGTRPMHREKPHKLLQVGVTPTPATNFGQCPGCRSVKPVSLNQPEADDWSVTSAAHQPSLAAQRRAKAVTPKHEAHRRARTFARASFGSASQPDS